jgi:hypothetical protein
MSVLTTRYIAMNGRHKESVARIRITWIFIVPDLVANVRSRIATTRTTIARLGHPKVTAKRAANIRAT